MARARHGVRRLGNQPHLTIQQILHWADEHFRRLDVFRLRADGPWRNLAAIDQALRLGLRGLAGGTTLYRLLRASKSGQTLDANID